MSSPSSDNYRARLDAEKERFADYVDVHALPAMFHYWSDKYIRPKLEPFGFSSPQSMFEHYLRQVQNRHPDEPLRFASVGAGNCELEVSLARSLVEQGRSDFVIDCLDLNPAMLERGRAAAANAGVERQIGVIECDFNSWTPQQEYHAILAHQSLHHVLNLEHLFDRIGTSLKDDGIFIISDMIGRNGHIRWPEAMEIVQEFWSQLPPSYRINRDLQRFEEVFENWDCSAEEFEGIRAQDILPLLIARFHFRFFVAFGNVIDPFVDRSFGHNFDANAAWDRAFIDRIHARDEEEMRAGNIKPTHMFAVVAKQPGGPVQCLPPMTPEFSVRAATPVRDIQPPQASYDWLGEPQQMQRELELVCRRLACIEHGIRRMTEGSPPRTAEVAGDEMTKRATWAHALDRELTQRTEWANRLVEELAEMSARSERLEKTVVERTEWALSLDRELAERTEWALRLNDELTRLKNQKPPGILSQLKARLRR